MPTEPAGNGRADGQARTSPPEGPAASSHGSLVDAHVGRYAARAKDMAASEIRALFSVAARPEIVSLAGGMPYVTALPLDAMGEMAGRLVAQRGAVALQYGSAQGDLALRDGICEVMALEGIRAHPDEVIVTVGSQQALDLITRIFVDPGDVVLAEAPSYVGALGTFASYQAQVVHVPMDDDGLVPEALSECLARLHSRGQRVKFLYTVPSFHNPAGVTLSAPRRAEVLRICQRAGVLIIEDNPYGLLGFDYEPQRALRADDSQGVVYLGSFSKTIAAGLRVGWAVAPAGIRDKLVLAAEAAVLCPSNLAQLVVGEYLASQPWREQVKVFRELYRERRDAMLDTLGAPGRGVLCLAAAATRLELQIDAAPGNLLAGGLRPRHRLLRRRRWRGVPQARLLLPRAGPDPGRDPPPGRGDRCRDRDPGHVRPVPGRGRRSRPRGSDRPGRRPGHPMRHGDNPGRVTPQPPGRTPQCTPARLRQHTPARLRQHTPARLRHDVPRGRQ